MKIGESVRNIVRVLFHALPMIPLYFERYYFGVAAILLVALAYIKTKKFELEVQRLKELSPPNQDRINESEKIMRRYRYLTFI